MRPGPRPQTLQAHRTESASEGPENGACAEARKNSRTVRREFPPPGFHTAQIQRIEKCRLRLDYRAAWAGAVFIPPPCAVRPVLCCPGCAGAYFDAHLAWSCVAWKTPSRPKVPIASAWELSLNVSGGGSSPL